MSHTYEDKPTREAWNALAESIPQIVTGSYLGDGNSSQKITLPFTPKAVLVVNWKGAMYDSNGSGSGGTTWGGLAVRGSAIYTDSGYYALECLTGGFYAYRSSGGASVNENGRLYNYIAIG